MNIIYMISLLSNYALYQRAILLGEKLSKAGRNRLLDTSTAVGRLSYVRGKLHSIENQVARCFMWVSQNLTYLQ